MSVTKDEIIELAAYTFICDINSITDETGIGHHPNWDSLGHVSLMLALEKKYKIVVDETNIEQLFTIAGIVRYLNEKQRIKNE